MEESSMPMAIILLSWGWNARNVAAGGGGMKVVIVCSWYSQKLMWPQYTIATKIKERSNGQGMLK